MGIGVPSPRPGGLQAAKEPATRPQSFVAGYDPKYLDERITKSLAIAERNEEMIEHLAPKVEKAIKEAEGFDANELTVIWDRLLKGHLNQVKAVDELSRLRSFVSGGPDTRPDLSSMGEIELRAIVLAAVKSLGVTDLRQLEEK